MDELGKDFEIILPPIPADRRIFRDTADRNLQKKGGGGLFRDGATIRASREVNQELDCTVARQISFARRVIATTFLVVWST